MEVKYNVTGAERKALVTALSEITNAAPQYKGAPSFAYEVDRYTVDKDGTVFCDEDCDVENLFAALSEKGFDAENTVTAVKVTLPVISHSRAVNVRRIANQSRFAKSPLAKAVKQVILRFYLGMNVEIDFIYEKSTIKDFYIFDCALVARVFRLYLLV